MIHECVIDIDRFVCTTVVITRVPDFIVRSRIIQALLFSGRKENLLNVISDVCPDVGKVFGHE